MSFESKILATAFATSQAPLHPKDIDLRQQPLKIREVLKGKPIPISFYGQHVYDIPEPLLKVTSIYAADFVEKGKVSFPDDAPKYEIEAYGVGIVVEHMKSLTRDLTPTLLKLDIDECGFDASLSVCLAVEALGMDQYVSHLVYQTYAYFDGLPSYLIIHKSWYPRVYEAAVRSHAYKVREGGIPDPETFEKYLLQRLEFAKDIEKAKVEHHDWIEKRAKLDQRLKEEETTKAKAVEARKAEKERLAREKQCWAGKNTQDTDMRKVVEEKTRATGDARRFTAEERTLYVKANGKQPPTSC